LSVDDARLRAAASEPGNWLTHGGTYAEQRYSTLEQIRVDNVAQLGLAWSLDTETNRGLEATPLVADGILYTTGSWSVVFAVDARSGRFLWRYDPQVPREKGKDACCDVVNRGVALYQGKVYVGTLDGRLIALDAASGRVVWETLTVDPSRPYTITGAPRVVEGNVLIGNGGAEFGVRGYLSAYDAATGKLAWRFYTVPGDPSKPQESKALERALPTWHGDQWWKVGGGGTCWDSMAYDPELHLLYVGTGNGSPWNRYVRSPGGGANLYLSSIVALRPDTGELVWYYQETPGEGWDYTATQHIILAELPVAGTTRKVLLHAPKNGFFYVLDRETGKLLSAANYVEVTWAKGIDLKTGKPIETKSAQYREKPALVKPSMYGGHNWQPMSFNPKTGLVYIPAQDVPALYASDKRWRYTPGEWNTATDFTLMTEAPRSLASGALLAWDPVKQREAWRVPYTTAWNGGTLTTAGNLVFQGTATGKFVAYRADSGEKLWEAPAGTGVIAAPVTYTVDGQQYVSVMAGWGGAFALAAGDAAAAAGVRNAGRLLTFRLGGTASLPAPPAPPSGAAAARADLPKLEGEAKRGEGLYAENCAVCHGVGAVSGGVLPDLRELSPEVSRNFEAIVLGGAKAKEGMPSFAKRLTAADLEAIEAYLPRQRAAQKPGVTGARASQN
jgi:quinohemoprotein ethanol dehydrogenase